jgi:hypothetical protein
VLSNFLLHSAFLHISLSLCRPFLLEGILLLLPLCSILSPSLLRHHLVFTKVFIRFAFVEYNLISGFPLTSRPLPPHFEVCFLLMLCTYTPPSFPTMPIIKGSPVHYYFPPASFLLLEHCWFSSSSWSLLITIFRPAFLLKPSPALCLIYCPPPQHHLPPLCLLFHDTPLPLPCSIWSTQPVDVVLPIFYSLMIPRPYACPLDHHQPLPLPQLNS